MRDYARPRLFLDSSQILAALFSESPESPGRRLFKMGEVGLIDLRISRDVQREVEGVLRHKTGSDFPTFRDALAETLLLANVAVAPDPGPETIRTCRALTRYAADALILAAAVEQNCEVLVAYDRQHLLHNPEIGLSSTGLVVMSGGEALAWAVDQVTTRARERQQQERAARKKP